MNVTAIKCEACAGSGHVWWIDANWRVLADCPLCSATGIERPPTQDEDIRAQQAIEGTRYENL